jgi:hypothetical protein
VLVWTIFLPRRFTSTSLSALTVSTLTRLSPSVLPFERCPCRKCYRYFTFGVSPLSLGTSCKFFSLYVTHSKYSGIEDIPATFLPPLPTQSPTATIKSLSQKHPLAEQLSPIPESNSYFIYHLYHLHLFHHSYLLTPNKCLAILSLSFGIFQPRRATSARRAIFSPWPYLLLSLCLHLPFGWGFCNDDSYNQIYRNCCYRARKSILWDYILFRTDTINLCAKLKILCEISWVPNRIFEGPTWIFQGRSRTAWKWPMTNAPLTPLPYHVAQTVADEQQALVLAIFFFLLLAPPPFPSSPDML